MVSAAAGMLVLRRLRRRVLRERARRFMEEGRIGETIATYERLLQFDRADVDVCKTLENLYEQEGLETKRKQVNEIIARLEPDNLQALSYLGRQQLAERRFLEAQRTWERILQQDPLRPEASFYLGVVLAERGQMPDAMTALTRALTLVIAGYERVSEVGELAIDPAVEAELAALLTEWEGELTQGMPYERARFSFQEARQSLAQRYVTQGQESLARDEANEAIRHLRWVNALNPADDAARALLKEAQTNLRFEQGLHYYQAQDYVQALRCFRETLALDPEHEKAKRYLRYAQQCLEGGLSERLRHLDLGDREKS
jgi:tetratricopeptide (TPR) repeat protein